MIEIDLQIFSGRCSGSLYKNNDYLINCDLYNESDLTLRTGSFDTSNISGTMKNVTTKLNTCSIIYKNVTFENCTFLEGSWFDLSEFINCNFIDCKFGGDMRWVIFNKCDFKNTTFNMKYIRRTTIKNNCTYDKLSIITKQIDEYIWFLGKRYSKNLNSYFGDTNLITINA